MDQPKKSLLLAAFFVLLLSLTESFAQTPTIKPSEPGFDIILQTVVASNDAAAKSDVASPLNGVVRKLKTDFPFSAYRLTSTAFQKVNNRNRFEIKNVSYVTEKDLAVFSDWSIRSLESLLDEKGQETIQIQDFRFGQRIPIINQNNTINYESIGLTTSFSLAKNTPTIVGSLATSKPEELMFLILTVKSAEK